jgi:uncharacterized membrane protein
MCKIIKRSNGNISIFSLILTLIFALLFLLLIDFCRIFIAREITKKASDAAALAVAQNLVFFHNFDCRMIAEKVTAENNCYLAGYDLSYDEVTIVTGKEMKFILIDKFLPKSCVIQSVSKTKVIYPWDDFFGYCKFYKFNY